MAAAEAAAQAVPPRRQGGRPGRRPTVRSPRPPAPALLDPQVSVTEALAGAGPADRAGRRRGRRRPVPAARLRRRRRATRCDGDGLPPVVGVLRQSRPDAGRTPGRRHPAADRHRPGRRRAGRARLPVAGRARRLRRPAGSRSGQAAGSPPVLARASSRPVRRPAGRDRRCRRVLRPLRRRPGSDRRTADQHRAGGRTVRGVIGARTGGGLLASDSRAPAAGSEPPTGIAVRLGPTGARARRWPRRWRRRCRGRCASDRRNCPTAGPRLGTSSPRPACRSATPSPGRVAMLSRIDFAAVYLGLLTRARPPIDSPDGLGRPRPAGAHLPGSAGRPLSAWTKPMKGVRFVELMHNRIRPYAWGSRTAIAELTGRTQPVTASAGRALDRRAPGGFLAAGRRARRASAGRRHRPGPGGHARCRRAHEEFDSRLPFLLKVLAAAEPLSLQAHPSAEQAARGFAAEEAARDPADLAAAQLPGQLAQAGADLRADPVPRALCGFREPSTTVRLLAALGVPQLDHYLGLLSGQPDAHGTRALFSSIITIPPVTLRPLLSAVLDGVRREGRARRRVHRRVPHGAGAGRALPGRSRGAGVAAAEPGHPAARARRCTCRPGTCMPTCPGSASRSWRTPTTCCAAV